MRYRDTEIWRYGDMEIWRYRILEISRIGPPRIMDTMIGGVLHYVGMYLECVV